MRAAITVAIALALLLLAGCGGEGCSDDCEITTTHETKTTLPPPCDERPEACR